VPVPLLCPQRWRPLEEEEQEQEDRAAQEQNDAGPGAAGRPRGAAAARVDPSEWQKERGPPPPPPRDPLSGLLDREDVREGTLAGMDPDDVFALGEPLAPSVWLPLWKPQDGDEDWAPARGEVRVRVRLLPPDGEKEEEALQRAARGDTGGVTSESKDGEGGRDSEGGGVRSSGYGQSGGSGNADGKDKGGGKAGGRFLKRKLARVKPQKVDWSHVQSKT